MTDTQFFSSKIRSRSPERVVPVFYHNIKSDVNIPLTFYSSSRRLQSGGQRSPDRSLFHAVFINGWVAAHKAVHYGKRVVSKYAVRKPNERMEYSLDQSVFWHKDRILVRSRSRSPKGCLECKFGGFWAWNTSCSQNIHRNTKGDILRAFGTCLGVKKRPIWQISSISGKKTYLYQNHT